MADFKFKLVCFEGRKDNSVANRQRNQNIENKITYCLGKEYLNLVSVSHEKLKYFL